MLSCDEVKHLIEQGLPGADAQVTTFGGGADHFDATVVAPQFSGLTRVKQHQLVYATIQQHLDSGVMHALGLKTFTPEQWAAAQNA